MPLGLRLCVYVLAMVGVGLSGCGDETGLLVEVSRDEATAEPDRLVILVGSGDASAGRFSDREDGDEAVVGGRDLASDPFRLLIRPSGDMDAMVMVAALGYRGDELVGFGRLPAPVGFEAGAVRSWKIVLGPVDGVDVGDGGCVRWPDEAGEVVISRPGDVDCDGWMVGEDCDDDDPTVHPGSSERCGNAVDDDCDGVTDEDVDEDGDGYTTCGNADVPPDCDDWLAEVNPGAAEACDGLDNDCSGVCDDLFDGDGDGYTICGSRILDDGSCKPVDPVYVDCNDDEAFAHPGKGELCDGLDNDCNGVCDDGPFDRDGDGFNECGSRPAELVSCARRDEWADCAPDDPIVHPAAAELCNGVDDNCDGELAIDAPCLVTVQGVACAIGFASCDEGGGGVGPCLGIASTPQPDPVCEVAVSCLEEGTDLAECAADLTVSDVCRFTHMNDFTCPGNSVSLPAGTGQCQWALAGSVLQGGLEVVLTSDLDPLGGTNVDGCNAELTVSVASEGDLNDSRDLYVTRTDASGVVVYHINLLIDEESDCAQAAGLECSGAIPGFPVPDPFLP